MFPDHILCIAGLFRDEQVKDARQRGKYRFLLIFFMRPSTPSLPKAAVSTSNKEKSAFSADGDFDAPTKGRNQMMEIS
jgi:hypothetical protein